MSQQQKSKTTPVSKSRTESNASSKSGKSGATKRPASKTSGPSSRPTSRPASRPSSRPASKSGSRKQAPPEKAVFPRESTTTSVRGKQPPSPDHGKSIEDVRAAQESPDNEKHAQERVETEKNGDDEASPAPMTREQDAKEDGDERNQDEETKEDKEEDKEDPANKPERELTYYPPHQITDPADFDPRGFLLRVDALSERLRAPELRALEPTEGSTTSLSELPSEVREVAEVMAEYRLFSDHAQEQLEKLRDHLKELKDRMYKRVHARQYDPTARLSTEERQIEAKSLALNKELARIAEELVRATQTTSETEANALTAAQAAERAEEEARIIQAEYEARRKADMEERRLEEERKREQEKRKAEEDRRLEEKRQAEEERRARLRGEQPEEKAPKWTDWPTFSYKAQDEEEQSLSCVVRGEPGKFRENDISVQNGSVLETQFRCAENEELVSAIITITTASGENKLPSPVQLIMPHLVNRVAAMTKEPVIRGRVADQPEWKEFKSKEVTLDGHAPDMKFVQAEITECGSYTVVNKPKSDYLVMSKKHPKVVSKVDQRITFETEKDTFKTPEHFLLQLQTVDSGTVNHIRKSEEGKQILASSAIVTLEWTVTEFPKPITMTLPCPPNPVKAKKAAAARAAKEAKAKKPPPSVFELEEQEKAKKANKKKNLSEKARLAAYKTDGAEEEEVKQPQKQSKWYMGQYGSNDDDESEVVYFVKKTKAGRWVVDEDIEITQPKLDSLSFTLTHPISKFMVLRVKPDVEAKDAPKLCEMLQQNLTEKTVSVILKQRSESGVDCCIYVVPVGKKYKILSTLEEQDYDDGPGASPDIMLREGELLEVQFRGNIKGAEDRKLEFVFSSQLNTSLFFEIEEVDKFLQKNYPNYRGFVQLYRKTEIPRPPVKKDKDEEDEEEPPIEYDYELICEHLVSVPKEIEDQQSLARAPVLLARSDNEPITDDTLRHLAVELGDEWQRLAQHLNVKRMRIQALLRNNMAAHGSYEELKYDMLISWAKRVPRATNKVEVLSQALTQAGRWDLALEIKEQAESFKHRRQVDARESHPSSRPTSRPTSRTASRASAQ